ncbi:hypothetical protein [Brunnivagina elsteri]|uniref:Uncharacterized protein n=1 Tax=Brunnivagina elsteri CCALA 953 TaxID=987040 RepID=A0A2A2TPM1_9CYAN|nr:hypothetical protein [Calothrix elsteri]PAX60400.1 hypothetical protein CK510_01870 [Calothrix elsteri CCALA 953]
MVELVIVINILISLMLLYAAWRLLRLRKLLTNAANALLVAERSTNVVLSKAPGFLYVRQGNISNLRLRNQVLELQIQQIRQLLSLLLFMYQLYSRYFGKLKLLN